MDLDLLDLYRRASGWTGGLTAGVTDMGGSTPCPDWTVRDLLLHMIDTQRYFIGAATGDPNATPPSSPPPEVAGDPVEQLAAARDEVVTVFSEPGVIDKTMPALGIAFADQLLHGWDLAKATGQDATMPEGLAEAAYGVIHGRFTDEQRKGVFGPELPAPDDATPQQRLLAYTGRQPD